MFPKKLCLSLLLMIALAGCKSEAEKAQDYYESALEFVESGDIPRARLELRNALKEQPTHLGARTELARLNMSDRNFPAAYQNYLRVSEQDPNQLEAQVNLSRISFLLNDWEAFERHSAAALKLAADDPATRIVDIAARYRQSVMAEDGPGRNAVVADAEKAQADEPDSEILRQILIDGYLQDARYEEALEQIEKAIAFEPKRQQFYMLKLQTLARIGDEQGLEAGLREVVSLFPEDLNSQANLLRFLMARGKTDEAEEFLRELVASAPEGEYGPNVTLVRFLLEVRSSEDALAELDRAITEHPDAYSLRNLHASLLYDLGRQDEAIAALQEIVDSDTPVPSGDLQNIKVSLAKMLSQNGNEVGARRIVEELLAEDANAVGALKMQARWMIDDDDTDNAVAAMRTALAASPQDFEAMTIMAEAYQRAGQKNLMMDFLSRAAEASNNAPQQSLQYAAALSADDKTQQAEGVLINALRMQPNNIDVLAALGRIYFGLDDLSRARQVIDTLKRIGDERAITIASRLELEMLARESGADELVSQLQTLAQQDDENNTAKIALIQTHLQSGNTEAARTLIQELIEQQPDNLAFVYFRGLAEVMAGELATAQATFTEMTDRNPDADLGWLQLARLQTIGNDPAATLKTLDDGLAANPGSPDLLWAKASYLQEEDDIDGAIEIYEQLYEMNSGSLVIANNLASLLATFRDDEASLERAKVIARRLAGTDVPALQDTYGWILYRSGDVEDALAYLEPAARQLPEDASVQFHLGEAYYSLGRHEEALTQMRLALEKVGPLGSGALSDEIQARIATLEASADSPGDTSPEN